MYSTFKEQIKIKSHVQADLDVIDCTVKYDHKDSLEKVVQTINSHKYYDTLIIDFNNLSISIIPVIKANIRELKIQNLNCTLVVIKDAYNLYLINTNIIVAVTNFLKGLENSTLTYIEGSFDTKYKNDIISDYGSITIGDVSYNTYVDVFYRITDTKNFIRLSSDEPCVNKFKEKLLEVSAKFI